MGHLVKIAQIILRQTTIASGQAKELKFFLERHEVWHVIGQIPLVEEKLVGDEVPILI